MTFQLSLDEWMEGFVVYSRSQNRFLPIVPVFLGALATLVVGMFAYRPDLSGGLLTALFVWGFLDSVWLARRRLRTRFRRYYPDGAPPLTYKFSAQGFEVGMAGAFRLEWSEVTARLEGAAIWVLVARDPASAPTFWGGTNFRLFIIPKHATQCEEGQREWAIVDAHFAPSSTAAPIAQPH